MADETLRVDPVVMQDFVVSLGGAARQLSAQLSRLDDQVGQMLGGWHGVAGAAYGSAWELWHHGARDVELGLSMLSRLVGHAGEAYQRTETGSTQEQRAVRGG
jgi:WXG100 family type VII secretion target